MALDRKGFEAREEELMGHSTEGGSLTIFSRKGVPQRIRAELYGETGKLVADAAYLNGGLMLSQRRTDYAEPLPRNSNRIRKVVTVTGFVCAGAMVIERGRGRESGQDPADELAKTATWLLDELKSRGIVWSIEPPMKR